jgi:hypothetical protein
LKSWYKIDDAKRIWRAGRNRAVTENEIDGEIAAA